MAGDRLVPYGDPMTVGDALVVVIAPDGGSAATGNRDGTIDLWDLARREKVGGLKGPKGGIRTAAFTSDGLWLVASGTDHQLWRWSVGEFPDGSGQVIADAGSVVWALAAAPSGSLVAAATGAGEVWLVDVASGNSLGEPISPGAGELPSVAFAPDGSTLLAGSGRGEVFVWTLPSRQLRFAPVAAHTSDVWEILVGESVGRREVRFVTVSSDGTARVWDLATGSRIAGGPFDASEAGIPLEVRGGTLGPGDGTLTLGGSDGALYAWSLETKRLVFKASPVHRDRITSGSRSVDGKVMATLADDRTVQVWTQRTRPPPLVEIAFVEGAGSSIAASPEGDVVVVGKNDGDVVLLDSATGAEVSRLEGAGPGITALVYQAPNRLASGDAAGTIRLWDAGSARILRERRSAHQGRVSALAYSGDHLVSSGDDGEVKVWDTANLDGVGKALEGLSGSVSDVAISAGGGRVAASTELGMVARWSISGRRLGSPFAATDDRVWAVALGERGESLAVAGADEVLSLWGKSRPGAQGGGDDLTRQRAFGSHRGGALDVVFVDPTTLAVSAANGRVQLWDAAFALGPGLPVSTAPVRHMATAGGVVWAIDEKGTVVRLDALSLPAACQQAAPSFDARQQARLLSGQALRACPAKSE